ncbi:hypothetical protein BOC51_34115 [Burkholderia pseudomallei]|nr:hypothetical protein BOC43_13245 [Burkholderia pseudomallei]EDO94442.1 hypothetical protein BURPSPAST_V0086 [Burkholderia pseudomallei Pasteur 52237]ARL55179.1 hypothetical protein BOC51_34115 [Burkholderia pseudomallei]AUG24411.1 hypothetical protein CXQ84_28915 [Burkholderia pseudomallei]AYX04109.1 hypothetical protein EGY14_09870 [Burkholderia pseudomallei]
MRRPIGSAWWRAEIECAGRADPAGGSHRAPLTVAGAMRGIMRTACRRSAGSGRCCENRHAGLVLRAGRRVRVPPDAYAIAQTLPSSAR